MRSGLGVGVGDVGRAFFGGRYGLLLRWDSGWLRPGLAPGDTDSGDVGPGTGAAVGILAGFVSLFNGPSRRRGRVARRRGVEQAVKLLTIVLSIY